MHINSKTQFRLRRVHSAHVLSLLLAVVLWLAPTPAARPRVASAAPTPPPANSLVAVMIELDAPPVTLVYAAALTDASTPARAGATRAAQAHLARVDAAQRDLLGRLTQIDATVLYRTQRVYNGVATLVDAALLAEIAHMPGVKAVHPIIPKSPDVAHSARHIGAPMLWQGMAGLPAVHGEGIRIGIIDTGIDYLHVDFGGPGAGYAQNDRRVTGDVAGFPGVKVAGGYDFVGETYNADPAAGNYQPMPEPDPDPYDCYGHGTHVAGIAGGYGVTSRGATYTGAYSADLQPADFTIGPGVAPHAQLYALKVFGCSGSSDVVDLAIEWSVDPNGDGDFADRMDVINLSLGSPYGDAYDTTAAAADNAAAAGVIVVASAGNARDNYFIVGTPSTGDGVISVAATQATGFARSQDDLSDAQLDGDTVASFSSRGPRRTDAALKPEIAAPGAAIISANSGSGNGARTLSGTSMAAPHVAGALALLRQLHPDWRPGELKALTMNTSDMLVTLDDGADALTYAPGRVGAGRIDLAAAGAATAVAFNADQSDRVGLSFGAPAVTDNYSAIINVRIVNKASAPVSYTVAYLPITDLPGVDLTAPPTPITVDAQGTSAFPLLLRADATAMQELRDPTVAAVQQSVPRAWLSEESGHLMLWPQSSPLHATLVDATGGAGGAAAFTFDPIARQLDYLITLTGTLTAPGMRVALAADGPQLAVDAVAADGLSASGVLTLSNAEVLQLASEALALYIFPAGDVGSLMGGITSAAPVLHLPVYAAPRPVASVRAAGPIEFPGDTAVPGALQLVGAVPLTAPVSLSILQLESPNTLPGSVANEEVDRFDHADLRYVGVASNLSAPDAAIADATIYFALATYAPWSTPNEVLFQVLIDRNEDGQPDALLVNSNVERFSTNRSDNDAYVTVFYDLVKGERSLAEPLNGVDMATLDTLPLFSSTMVLGVKAAMLGLSEQNSGFTYRVVTTSNDLFSREDMIVEETAERHFDLRGQPYFFAPGSTGALVESLSGPAPFALQMILDPISFMAAGKPRLLLLHHRGAPDDQAETPDARYTWPHQVHMPLVAR